MTGTSGITIAGTNFAFLWSESFERGCAHLADLGATALEFTASWPHLDLSAPIEPQAERLRGTAEKYGLRFTSVNPLDFNLLGNPPIGAAALDGYRSAVRLAGLIGAPAVVVVPGRLGLTRVPAAIAEENFRVAARKLVELGEAEEVSIAFENTPFGFLETPTALAPVIRSIGSSRAGLTVDLANLHFIGADPEAEFSAASDLIVLAHISDTSRDRFAHTYFGDGDLDVETAIAALRASGYSGDLVSELVPDCLDWSRWSDDLSRIADALGGTRPPQAP